MMLDKIAEMQLYHETEFTRCVVQYQKLFNKMSDEEARDVPHDMGDINERDEARQGMYHHERFALTLAELRFRYLEWNATP